MFTFELLGIEVFNLKTEVHISKMSTGSSSTVGARYAIAVNNIGVELLHKHCYAQAGTTFEDSLLLLKAPLNNNFLELAQDFYQRALDRILRPDPSHRASNPPPYMITVVTWNNCTSTCYSRQGHTHTLDDVDVEAGVSLAQNQDASSIASKSWTTLYPFRMEDVDLSTGDCDNITGPSAHDSEFLKVESSIIMHNFGLSFMCQAASNWGTTRPQTVATARPSLSTSTPPMVINAPCFRSTIVAARLLKIAASVWFEENTGKILLRYSLSSTGSYALHYFMKNLQALLILHLHPLQNAFTEVAEALLSLSEALETIRTLLRTIRRWNSDFFPSLSASSVPTSDVDVLPDHVFFSDSIAPAA
jgi:hypothetical protein